jgi:hypothetical protein
MAIAVNAAYSPDLAPSDCYLFGHMKDLLSEESFEQGSNVIGGRWHFCGASKSGR